MQLKQVKRYIMDCFKNFIRFSLDKQLINFLIVLLFFLVQINVKAQGPQQMFWALNSTGTYLLDQIGSTDASVAYSVRKLRKNYNGFAMRVRRSGGGSPEGDVAFDANGVVSANSMITITDGGGGYSVGDVVQFSTFYSGRSVYVMTWYDQSGNNRHVSQSTNSQQPRIVNSGTLETSNSIASIRFINSDETVLTANIPSSTMFGSGYIGTASLVVEASNSSTSSFGYSDGGSDRWQAHINESNNLYFDVGTSYNRLSYSNSASIGNLRTYALVAGNSLMEIWLSGTRVANSSPSMSASTTNNFYVGAIPTFPGTWYHNNDQSEIIIFPKALSATEIGIINRNQKTFYGTP